MDEHRERASAAISAPLDSGAGMSGSMGVAAPLGTVSRKDQARADRTALSLDGETLVLRTELPGTVTLQVRGADGTWDTLERRPASRLGRTRLDLPPRSPDAAEHPSRELRVVFAPRNGHIAPWISPPVDG